MALIPDLFADAAVSVVVSRPVFDEYGEIASYADEAVQNVIVAPTNSDDSPESTRPYATEATMTFHFPKTYTASLRGCRIAYDGHTYEVDGDPQPYMDALTPGPRNRPVQAKAVLG